MLAESFVRQTRANHPHDFASVGPSTLGGRYLRQFWHPVAVSSNIKPGQAKPIKILNEEFTLYRGQDGAPHIVAHRCPHRGTQLSAGFVEGDAIRCLYHGWKYGPNGQCVETPYESDGFAAKVRIGSYPTGEFIGLIWGYFGEGEAPAFPPLPPFDEGGFVEIRDDFMPCNYFQTHENDFDPFHAVWTHSRNAPHNYFSEAFVVGEQPPIEETDWGIIERVKLRMLPHGSDFVIALFPPCTLRTLFPAPSGLYEEGLCPPNRDAYLIHVPIDDESCRQYFVMDVQLEPGLEDRYAKHFASYEAASNQISVHELGLAILEGRTDWEQAAKHPSAAAVLALLEDCLAQTGQGVVADRSAERLGRSDINIVQMRRIWAREFDKIAEGATPKRWARLTDIPAELRRMKDVYRDLGIV